MGRYGDLVSSNMASNSGFYGKLDLVADLAIYQRLLFSPYKEDSFVIKKNKNILPVIVMTKSEAL